MPDETGDALPDRRVCAEIKAGRDCPVHGKVHGPTGIYPPTDVDAALGEAKTAEDWVVAAGYWLDSSLGDALPGASPMFKALVDVLGECKRRGDDKDRLRAENEALRKRADESDQALRKFQAGLTDTLRVYNVPAMPSWPEAIHWLARNGRRGSDEERQP